MTASSATIAGALDTGGAPTKAHVEFGTTTAYGAATADQIVGPATTPQPFAAQIAGLPAGTTIHYRVVALNDTGTVVAGADQTLTTQSQGGGGSHKPKLKLLGGHLVVRIDRHGRVHLRVRSSAAVKGTLAITPRRQAAGQRQGQPQGRQAEESRSSSRARRAASCATPVTSASRQWRSSPSATPSAPRPRRAST